MRKKNAFTLAEVLITLGIIGVVAAMTLPTLIQKNNNSVVEARLKKFYSAINQAIQMSESVNGDRKIWSSTFNTFSDDSDEAATATIDDIENWFNTYLKPYMKVIKTEKESKVFTVYFSDGSAMSYSSWTSEDVVFYVGNPKKCRDKYQNGVFSTTGNGSGRCSFLFRYSANENYDFGPYKLYWDGNPKSLSDKCKNGQRQYCTAVIQMNGWKIPDDYPWKVSY